jgi:S-adenosylmethionine:tRNA ribosyltransferase-isomerase
MSRAMRKVIFQLDYHMSSQFAGIAMGLHRGLYKQAGINLQWLPPCAPGDEAKVVEDGYHKSAQEVLWAGCMEQNTLLPAVAAGCNIKAVAAMFGKSPLCLAALPGSRLRERLCSGDDGLRVGAHVDTVDLVQRLMPNAHVEGLPREDKMGALHGGHVDAIQAYDVMETLKLQYDVNDKQVEVVPLESHAFPGTALGYSQVIFAPVSAVNDPHHHQTLRDFVQVTFDGWAQAIREPGIAAEAILKIQPHDIDHWVHSERFLERSVQLCGNYVKATMRCGQLGFIDASRWDKAAAWLGAASADALDQTVWTRDAKHVDGHPTAQRLFEKTRSLAEHAKVKHGRAPKLVMIAVGQAALGRTHPDGERRLQLFASPTSSWFSMTSTGMNIGIDVVEVDLPACTTTEGILRELRCHSGADGIVLAWPLPPSIDAEQVCASIPVSKDVDGVLFLARGGAAKGFAPATCSAVVQLLDDHQVKVQGSHVVVIGSSSLLGRPLAHLLGSQGATVTMLHSRSDDLETFCKQADILIAAAGVPRLVRGAWVRDGAVVINIGTTFEEDTIIPDIALCQELSHAKLVVRTIGPLSAAMLLHNVAQSAAIREVQPSGATASTPALSTTAILRRLEDMPGWSMAFDADGVQSLHCDYWMPCYKSAVDFIDAIRVEADRLNHHPNLHIKHRCVDGVTVSANIFTHAISSISEFDFGLAQRVNQIYLPNHELIDHVPDTNMADFRYVLPDSSIAQFPASPRGSSRLLVALPRDASASSPDFSTKSFPDLPSLLPRDAHLVCNASQVFAARIFANAEGDDSNPIEVMFLSPEPSDTDPATLLPRAIEGQTWRCMVRCAIDEPGFKLFARSDGLAGDKARLCMTVARLHSAWLEEGEADGVEVTIRLSCSDPSMSAQAVFGQFGCVPLPPYMRRTSQETDKEAYQTVFASDTAIGSVAAPTAGLHFTENLVQTLRETGRRWSQCALHVGAGTFRPVTADKISDHIMHAEMFTMSLSELENVIDSLDAGRKIVAVGTTSVRVLETLYWLGVAPDRLSASGMCLGQWDAYLAQQQLGCEAPKAVEALRQLHANLVVRGDNAVFGSTRLCIVPGYDFKVCDALITNFHQPDSTLMLLVSAFAGKDTIMAAYQYALDHDFRFLSYGDSSLLFRQPK